VVSGNPSRGEGGDVEQVARTLKQTCCFCDCLVSLTLSFSLIALFVLIAAFYILAIILCLCYYIVLYILYVGLSVYPHISKKTIVHLNSYLEELSGEVLELLIGNPALLLTLS